MVDRRRWSRAQEYEVAFRHDVADRDADLSWYEWRAKRLAGRLEELELWGLADGDARVLEIGSGPVGLTSFYPARRRVAVDPLANEFTNRSALVGLRGEGAHYVSAACEGLPVRDGAFDLVVIENCIDHVCDVDAVMEEITRMLSDSGVLYLTVNCRSAWGRFAHSILARLQLDPGHTHSFSVARLRRMMSRHGFRIEILAMGPLDEARWNDLTSGELKAVAKAVLGVSYATARVVARCDGDG